MIRKVSALIALGVLSACGDPLRGIETLDDVALADEPVVAALPADDDFVQQGGLFSRWWGQPEDARAPVEEPVAELPVGVTAAPEQELPAEEAPEPLSDVAIATAPEPEPEAKPRSNRSRVISWLTRQAPKPAGPVEVEATEAPAEEAPVALASLPEDLVEEPTATDAVPAEPLAKPAPQKRDRKPLFGGAKPKTQKPEAATRDVVPGEVLVFGEVGRNCEARSMPLGKKVETSDTRGGVYTIYDTAPGSTAPRTFYVTGFEDKCPRQITAALAMFGAPAMHEQLRYGLPAKEYPYSATDAAYERVKKKICGVTAKKPCGSKIEFLERNTVFISAYERFTDNARWADVLIHDGSVLAASLKAR